MFRFISWLVTGVAAAFLAVSTAAFSPPSIAWLAFAISIGTLTLSTGVAYGYPAHTATRAAGLLTAAVSAWTIVASLVFSQSTVQHLALASSLAIGGLALAGITAHELSEEQAVEYAAETAEHESRLRTAA
jgi:low temperature requirement protein LtrA